MLNKNKITSTFVKMDTHSHSQHIFNVNSTFPLFDSTKNETTYKVRRRTSHVKSPAAKLGTKRDLMIYYSTIYYLLISVLSTYRIELLN